MPARREFTAEELAARLATRREQNRLAQQRRRARQHDRHADPPPVSMTRQHDRAPETAAPVSMTPSPPTPPSSSTSKEVEKIGRILEPFASRGYQHNPEFWADMAATYPDARLVAEAYNVASWLKKPLKKNRETPCSEGFLINWLKKAQRDAAAPPTNGAARPAPVDVPPGGVRNPGPAPVLPAGTTIQRIDPAEMQRAMLQAKRMTLPEKLALVRNGREQ
jgi:hypothetical protein